MGTPMTVTVPRPTAPEIFDPVGAKVTMRTADGATMHAALVLLVLPLVVFVAAVIICHLLKTNQLVSAVVAVASAALVYLAIYLRHRKNPKLDWTVIDLTPADA